MRKIVFLIALLSTPLFAGDWVQTSEGVFEQRFQNVSELRDEFCSLTAEANILSGTKKVCKNAELKLIVFLFPQRTIVRMAEYNLFTEVTVNQFIF